MFRSSLALVVLLCGPAIATDFPSNVKARLSQRDDFGSKLKVAYDINTPEFAKVWMCVGCNVNEEGSRMSNEGKEVQGATCGGYPNGCASLRGFEWVPSSDVSINFRINSGPWSPETFTFSIGEVVKGQSGVTHLEVSKEEL